MQLVSQEEQQSPLTLIPVGGVFDRVGVDIKFINLYNGNQYAVVFMDYLLKDLQLQI